MTERRTGPSAAEVDHRPVLRDLLGLLCTAAGMQTEAEAVMAECLAAGPKGAVLARRAARVTGGLIVLLDRARRLPGLPVVEEGRALLRYHHALVAATVGHAYDPVAIVAGAPDPRFTGHLGEPAARLRCLRDHLTAYLAGGHPDHNGFPLRTVLDDPTGAGTSAAHLARSADDVLLLASILDDGTRPETRWSEPGLILGDALARVQLPVGAVSVEPHPSPLPVLCVDPVLVARALHALVDNAIRHNAAGTPVRIGVSAGPAGPEVSVADEGDGLPVTVAATVRTAGGRPEVLARLGTGIALASAVAGAHGGTLVGPSALETIVRRGGGGCHWRLVLPGGPRGSDAGG